jgi:hypothetical protein
MLFVTIFFICCVCVCVCIVHVITISHFTIHRANDSLKKNKYVVCNHEKIYVVCVCVFVCVCLCVCVCVVCVCVCQEKKNVPNSAGSSRCSAEAALWPPISVFTLLI